MGWGDAIFGVVLAALLLWSAFGLGAWRQRNVDVRIIYKAMEDGYINEADAEAAMLFIRHGRS